MLNVEEGRMLAQNRETMSNILFKPARISFSLISWCCGRPTQRYVGYHQSRSHHNISTELGQIFGVAKVCLKCGALALPGCNFAYH